MLVAKCQTTEAVFAHVVPQKGVGSEMYAVERLKRDTLWFGHAKVILKSDSEPAIMKLLKGTLQVLRVDGLEYVREDHSAAYGSSPNASTEKACRDVARFLTTFKFDLEDSIRVVGGTRGVADDCEAQCGEWRNSV